MVKSPFFKTVLHVKSGKGMSLFTAAVLLGIMILPTIITVSKTSLDAVPDSYYEGSLALGATHERSVFYAVLPAAKSGVLSAVILGIGRAIGETMAVVMVAGNQTWMPKGLFQGLRTMTSNIVIEMGYAADLHREALIATGVVLFVFILLINLCFSLVKGGRTMPEIAAAQTAADMTYAKPHEFLPTGGSNRRAARAQAAALRWLVRMAALLTAAVLVFLIGYILVMGIPNLKPELFAWEYNSENVSLTPALINTVLMTAFAGDLDAAGHLCGHLAGRVRPPRQQAGQGRARHHRDLQGIPSIVYGLFGMLFFVTKLHWGYSMIAGAFTLAIMVLPVIMRTTEEALIAVPDSYREGSFGLGAGKLRTVFTIVLPSAMPGILSGVILATGRIVGETAALIYTASSVAKIPSGVFSSHPHPGRAHVPASPTRACTSARPTARQWSCWCWCLSSTACPALWPAGWRRSKATCGRRGRRPYIRSSL